MNFNHKRSVTDEQNERHKRLLTNILKEEGNKSCADCKTRNPTWASVNLGVFVCLTCSGIHRSLGVHISQVRSCNLDTWLPKQVEFCRVMGNSKGNRYWEARLPKDFRRPPSGNPNPELSAFIRAKYVDHAFAATDAQPPTIENYLNHPYGADAELVHSPPAAPAAAVTPAAMPRVAAPDLFGSSMLAQPAQSEKAPAAALIVDLLGGFDDLTVATMPISPPAAPASNSASDPFGCFVSAPPPAAPASSSHLNAFEWTDFHTAAPSSSSSPSLTSLQQLTVPPTTSTPAAGGSGNITSGHHRSHSISEGVGLNSVGVTSSTQSSYLGHNTTISSTQPEQQQLIRHHSRTQSQEAAIHYHQRPQHHNQQHCTTTGQNGSAAAYDPFAPLPPDDLLAGLTIHHVMESMASPPATPPLPPLLPAEDPFQFSSSAMPTTHVECKPAHHVRSSHHKRHPSNAFRASEEVLRLFDTESSTGTTMGGGPNGNLGAAAATSSINVLAEDPFGDFIGVAAVPTQNGSGAHAQHNQHNQLPSNQSQQLTLETHVVSKGLPNNGAGSLF